MNMKNVKMLLTLALKRGTSQTFLQSLITSKSLEYSAEIFLGVRGAYDIVVSLLPVSKKTVKIKNNLTKSFIKVP
jgi:hypothetical protein